MTLAFVYKWVHIPTLRWYIGSRTAKNCHPDDGYICSNKTIKELINKNSSDWTRTIIALGSKEEMFQLETDILLMFDARNDPRSFNSHNNEWGLPVSGPKHYMKQTKWREVQSKRSSGENNPFYGIKRFGENNPMYGVERSTEWKNSMTGQNNPLLKTEHQKTCSRCGKTMPKNVYRIWGHGDDCGVNNSLKKEYSNRMSGKNNPQYGLSPHNKILRVHTPLGHFNSVHDAALAHNVCDGTILYRIKSKSKKFKEYYK